MRKHNDFFAVGGEGRRGYISIRNRDRRSRGAGRRHRRSRRRRIVGV